MTHLIARETIKIKIDLNPIKAVNKEGSIRAN